MSGMSIFDVGRLCVKIAGRDAGRKCVVVEQLDNTSVLVDGGVRRKKVNVKHLEPLNQVVKLKKGASHEEVKKEFEEIGFLVWETKAKQAAARPKKQKKVKYKVATVKKETNEKKSKKEEHLPVEESKVAEAEKSKEKGVEEVVDEKAA